MEAFWHANLHFIFHKKLYHWLYGFAVILFSVTSFFPDLGIADFGFFSVLHADYLIGSPYGHLQNRLFGGQDLPTS